MAKSVHCIDFDQLLKDITDVIKEMHTEGLVPWLSPRDEPGLCPRGVKNAEMYFFGDKDPLECIPRLDPFVGRVIAVYLGFEPAGDRDRLYVGRHAYEETQFLIEQLLAEFVGATELVRPEITDQQLFDSIATHMLTQNAQAKIGSSCKLRDAAGRSCAVGCRISDEDYHPRLEGLSLGCDTENTEAVLAALDFEPTDHQLFMLKALQRVHDQADAEYWPARLDELAKSWKLATPALLKERLGQS